TLGYTPDGARNLLSTVEGQGLAVSTLAGRTATGLARIIDLPKIADAPTDVFIEAAAAVHAELDRCVPEAWHVSPGAIPADATGAGVVIGIIDSGIDIIHPSFRHPNGGTRLLALWDQSSSHGP